MAVKTRKIVHIEEDKCDGCGLCVPGCAEGAVPVVVGKARLVAENLCDGLGNCLGTCPKDAITIEERPAEAFDAEAVQARTGQDHTSDRAEPDAPIPSGCPGSMMRTFGPKRAGESNRRAGTAGRSDRTSALGRWPVQLSLLPTSGAIWQDADALIAADCAAYAMSDFHRRLLAGRTLAIACPELDEADAYVAKLTEIFARNTVRRITVARMEVPCCGGLERIVRRALNRADVEISLDVVTVSTQGSILDVNGLNVTWGA